MKKFVTTASLLMIVLVQAAERKTINVVGSSTVFPFSAVVAENFGKSSSFKTPKIESTGSAGGIKLFCSGTGIDAPDVVNASRRMKATEFVLCKKNGVTDITEILIGFDGIVIANSNKAPQFGLTRQQLFQALAKEVPNPNGSENFVPNPYNKWSDIDASLPNTAIEILGPPLTSGTRDTLSELVLKGGCQQYGWTTQRIKQNKKQYRRICRSIREDGLFIEAGENDNLIVKSLEANPNALGLFGYSFLEQNADTLHAVKIEGLAPTFATIASGEYKLSRPLYFYVKNAHIGKIPGIKEYIELFISEDAVGDGGFLVDKGLIPLPVKAREANRKAISEGKKLAI